MEIKSVAKAVPSEVLCFGSFLAYYTKTTFLIGVPLGSVSDLRVKGITLRQRALFRNVQGST